MTNQIAPGASGRRVAVLTALPVLPAARASALSMLQDGNLLLGDLATLISSDPGLTLVLLRAANSALSASRRRIEHARDAMIRIGLAATKRVVAATVVGGAFSSIDDCGIDIDAFWAYSLAVAIGAESAADSPRLRPAAFSAGLLHDVGRLAFAMSLPSAYEAIAARAKSEPMTLAAERLLFGEDHASASARIVLSWGVSPEIAQAIGQHHQLVPLGDLDQALIMARRAAEGAGYTDGLRRPNPVTSDLVIVDANTAALLHERVEWYRSALGHSARRGAR